MRRKLYFILAFLLMVAQGAWATVAVNGKLPGAFSVSATKQVWFSQGNLQHSGANATGTWSFAANQYDRYGTNQTDDHRDLFGWGTKTTPNNTSTDDGDYTWADWGENKISNGGNLEGVWSTLTATEWQYLFDRTNYRTMATVHSVPGLIMMPDDWTATTVNPTITVANYTTNVLTDDQWTVLEDQGCVFLPTNGWRDGTNYSMTDEHAIYWTSTTVTNTTARDAYIDGSGHHNIWTNENHARHLGFCVRLVLQYWQGSGTAQDPYLINNTYDWNKLSYLVNNGQSFADTYFRLTADIDVTTIVGSSEKPFSGTLDSNGHSIQTTTNNWSYSSSGNVLSAYGEGGYTAENPLSITISAPADLQFDGTYKPATISNTSAWTAAGLTVPTIYYNGITHAPSLLGTYTASISAGGATAEVTYTIKTVINYQSFFDGGLTQGKNFDVVAITGAYEVALNNSEHKGVYWDTEEKCAVFDGEAYLQINNPLGNVTTETGFTLTMDVNISSNNNGSGSFIRSTGVSASKNGWQRLFELSDGNPDDCIFINAGNANNGTAHLMWCLRKGNEGNRLEVWNNTGKSYNNQWCTVTMVVAPGGYTTLYVNGEVLTHSSSSDIPKITNVLNYISSYDKCYIGTSIFEVIGSNADGFFIGKIRGFQTAEGALMPYYDGTNYHYLLSYATNGGNPITGTFEATIPDDLPTPTRTDGAAEFAGWYMDEALTVPAVSGTTLTRNTALYAKWTPYVASVTTSGDVTTYYTTFSDALAAWEANSTLKLLTNVETASTITVSVTSILDLNGCGIKMTGTGPVIRVGASKTFTLNDSDPTATHKFSVTDNLATLDEANGTLTIYGGYITGGRDCRGSAIDVSNNNASNFIMNAGTLIGNNNGSGDNLGTVCVARDAYEYYNTFIMNGGAICYNNAVGIGVLPVGTANINGGKIHHNNGAGIRMWRSQLLTLNNAEITNNTASGIYVDAREAAIQVQGRTIITDNTLSGNPADVNYDRGDNNRTRPLAIVGALHSEALIGIYYNPTDSHSALGSVFTSDLSGNGDASNFFSNLNDYYVKINGDGEALLAELATITSPPTAKNGLVYSGAAQELVNAGTANGGTMMYSTDNSTWSSSIPTATAAGEYTVYYKVEGDATHTDCTPTNNTVVVSISPASVTLTANSDTKAYNGEEQTVTGFTSSVEGLTFEGVSAGGSGTNTGTYDVTFTGVTVNETKDATNNYVVTGTTNGTLTIETAVFNYGAATITWNENEKTATFDGTSLGTINITSDIAVNAIVLNRTFTAGKPATIMLPFTISLSKISGATFYTFSSVTKPADKWIATMTEVNQVKETLEANTPYLVVPTGETLTFMGGATLNTTGGGNQQTADAGSNWTFKGTYSYMKWTTDTSDPDYNAERADEIGKAYGFAGVPNTGIEVGDFVRVASGAKIRPMGCYLLWSDTPNSSSAPARKRARAANVDELPSRITVLLVSANGETTGIGELNTTTGEISLDRWWTLDGVKLSGKPAKKGLYIHNGNKVIIK